MADLPSEEKVVLTFKNVGASGLTCMFCNREACPNLPEYEASYRRTDGARVTTAAHSHCINRQTRTG